MNKKVSIGVFRFLIAIMTAYLLADAPVLFAHDYDLLSTAQIIVDGNSSDWSNISPAMTDSTGDSEAFNLLTCFIRAEQVSLLTLNDAIQT